MSDTEESFKKCFNCKQLLSTSRFDRNKTYGFSSYCKDCKKIFDKRYWDKCEAEGRPSRIDRHRLVKKRNMEFVLKYFTTHPCVDCGNENPVQLQFDHFRDKVKNVSEMIAHMSIRKISEEIEKCNVRCVNCHLIKTAAERGYYKYKMSLL